MDTVVEQQAGGEGGASDVGELREMPMQQQQQQQQLQLQVQVQVQVQLQQLQLQPQPQRHSHHHHLDKDKTNVFVKYLPSEVDSDGLHALFETYGKIVSAKVMVNQETGQSLGYGYILSSTSSFSLSSLLSCLSFTMDPFHAIS